eukprot:COSAG06_NODE_27193_length_598_cov_1.438878_1_plen_168_part_01
MQGWEVSEQVESMRMLANRPYEAKRSFFSHLCIKTIILPRQARDKRRKNSKNGFLPLGIARVRKRVPLLRCHFILKMIILPRQARDNHRENSKGDTLFAGEELFTAYDNASISTWPVVRYPACHEHMLIRYGFTDGETARDCFHIFVDPKVRNRSFFEFFLCLSRACL